MPGEVLDTFVKLSPSFANSADQRADLREAPIRCASRNALPRLAWRAKSRAGKQEFPMVYPTSGASPHFLIFMLTPDAARANFKPCMVDTSCMTTPFWFFMALAEPPPATVTPAFADG
jgi:hypothetical protein